MNKNFFIPKAPPFISSQRAATRLLKKTIDQTLKEHPNLCLTKEGLHKTSNPNEYYAVFVEKKKKETKYFVKHASILYKHNDAGIATITYYSGPVPRTDNDGTVQTTRKIQLKKINKGLVDTELRNWFTTQEELIFTISIVFQTPFQTPYKKTFHLKDLSFDSASLVAKNVYNVIIKEEDSAQRSIDSFLFIYKDVDKILYNNILQCSSIVSREKDSELSDKEKQVFTLAIATELYKKLSPQKDADGPGFKEKIMTLFKKAFTPHKYPHPTFQS